MLTFISFWRAAAIVLCDLASSAYYAGGISEKAIGKAAPWFILAVMLFSILVRMLYMESCALFVRGGVYKTVRAALGGSMAKLAVSALAFDYILTGPISGVAAGHYLAHFLNSIFPLLHVNWHLPENETAIVVAVMILLYFWWKNTVGIEESSDKALKIMQATGVMVVIIIIWSLITIAIRGAELPPFVPHLSDEALGWLHDVSWVKQVAIFGVLIGFGHSILAMSGEESLAQVYREIESPKLKNLARAGIIISIFSITFTALATFFAVMIIPDDVRLSQYGENLISGLAMHMEGPYGLRLAFQAFVVVVGALILGGAANTSIVGCNGVLNRVTEDGILPSWFKGLHEKYGTTHRLINLIVGIQLATVFLSGGDVFVLGEAYAFGVIWSFVFNALSMTVLRFKDKTPREFKVPGNFHIGSVEIPAGLITIASILTFVAITNFFTKTVATQAGIVFTAVLFVIFTVTEKIYHRKHAETTEHFNLDYTDAVDPNALGLTHKQRILIGVYNPNTLTHLSKRLTELTDEADIIVLSSRYGRAFQLKGDQVEMTPDELELFSKVVIVAEKHGRDVIPMIIPTNDAIFALMKTAADLKVNEVVVGLSRKISPEIQMEQLAMAWGHAHPAEARPVTIRIISETHEMKIDLI